MPRKVNYSFLGIKVKISLWLTYINIQIFINKLNKYKYMIRQKMVISYLSKSIKYKIKYSLIKYYVLTP